MYKKTVGKKMNAKGGKTGASQWEEAGAKAKKQAAAVILLGLVLLMADIAVASARDRAEVVEDGGALYIVRPEAGGEAGSVSLRAKIEGESETVEKDVRISVEPRGNVRKQDGQEEEQEDSSGVMSERERLEYGLRDITNGIDDSGEERVPLPGSLETGERISWEVRDDGNSDAFAIVMITMATSFIVYRNRFAAIRKREKKNRESVVRQLPEFVNRLVLLLNAGLVLTSAFERATEDGIAFNGDENDYFYGTMREIYDTCRATNGSLYREFAVMAKKSGIRELIRVSNIINDNVEKGVELTGKLQTESELLWMNRKKNCEEKGRLAETKLTLPLMIFLMVLIIITVAPAMLEL